MFLLVIYLKHTYMRRIVTEFGQWVDWAGINGLKNRDTIPKTNVYGILLINELILWSNLCWCDWKKWHGSGRNVDLLESIK